MYFATNKYFFFTLSNINVLYYLEFLKAEPLLSLIHNYYYRIQIFQTENLFIMVWPNFNNESNGKINSRVSIFLCTYKVIT